MKVNYLWCIECWQDNKSAKLRALGGKEKTVDQALKTVTKELSILTPEQIIMVSIMKDTQTQAELQT